MSDVQTNAPLDIEDAILAQWEDADKQLSEDTTEATPQDDQEETTDIQEVDEDTEEEKAECSCPSGNPEAFKISDSNLDILVSFKYSPITSTPRQSLG